MNPIRRLREWLGWRRRDRETVFIGSWAATTRWCKDGAETGAEDRHIVTFFRDGNGQRWSEVESTMPSAAESHHGVLTVRHNWRHFGALPDGAARPQPAAAPPGPLRVIPGGKSGDAA